ncbi:hypothetical protein H4Q26_015635 [Puccinia striiformis f. sp. tritici PST-130]|nr:hypothetical protein H4Q26_015635 [Puccinia striiformis f. sp. tritici PST-130]
MNQCLKTSPAAPLSYLPPRRPGLCQFFGGARIRVPIPVGSWRLIELDPIRPWLDTSWGNNDNTSAGENVAPTPTKSATGESARPGPNIANTASQPANHPESATNAASQPANHPEPVTNTARFPNQSTGDRSVPAPRRDSGQANKAKSSIAAAFEASTDKKFEYLDKHMAMEKDKFSWEKEKYNNEREATLNRSNIKKAAAEQWLLEGRSVAEVEALMRAIYGTPSRVL